MVVLVMHSRWRLSYNNTRWELCTKC